MNKFGYILVAGLGVSTEAVSDRCSQLCTYAGTTYKCMDRMSYAMFVQELSEGATLTKVNSQCYGQCFCDSSDMDQFGAGVAAAKAAVASQKTDVQVIQEAVMAVYKVQGTDPLTIAKHTQMWLATNRTNAISLADALVVVPPSTPGGCSADCFYGDTKKYSCMARVNWQLYHSTGTVDQANALVNSQCQYYCSCNANDLQGLYLITNAAKAAIAKGGSTVDVAQQAADAAAAASRREGMAAPLILSNANDAALAAGAPAALAGLVASNAVKTMPPANGPGVCSSMCVYRSDRTPHSCAARIEYLISKADPFTLDAATTTVNSECADWCQCTSTEASQAKADYEKRIGNNAGIVQPPSPMGCNSICVLNGEKTPYTCSARIYFGLYRGSGAAQDIAQKVNSDCAAWCQCSNADVAQAQSIAAAALATTGYSSKNKPYVMADAAAIASRAAGLTPAQIHQNAYLAAQGPGVYASDADRIASAADAMLPLVPVVPGDCNSKCVYGQERTPYTCAARYIYGLKTLGSTLQQVTDDITRQCHDFCACTQTEVHDMYIKANSGSALPPASPGGCNAPCVFGQNLQPSPCMSRVTFLLYGSSASASDALGGVKTQVNDQCSQWCSCSDNELANLGSITTAVKAAIIAGGETSKVNRAADAAASKSRELQVPQANIQRIAYDAAIQAGATPNVATLAAQDALSSTPPSLTAHSAAVGACNAPCVYGVSRLPASCETRARYIFDEKETLYTTARKLEYQCSLWCHCNQDALEAIYAKSLADRGQTAIASPQSPPATPGACGAICQTKISSSCLERNLLQMYTLVEATDSCSSWCSCSATDKSKLQTVVDAVKNAVASKVGRRLVTTSNLAGVAADTATSVARTLGFSTADILQIARAAALTQGATPADAQTIADSALATAPPPTTGGCNDLCVYGGDRTPLSCSDRLTSLFRSGDPSVTVASASDQVNSQCSGWCGCSSAEASSLKVAADQAAASSGVLQATPPDTPGDCRAPCIFGVDKTPFSCFTRMGYLMLTMKQPADLALTTVNSQCSTWCSCSATDGANMATVLGAGMVAATKPGIPGADRQYYIADATVEAARSVQYPDATVSSWTQAVLVKNGASSTQARSITATSMQDTAPIPPGDCNSMCVYGADRIPKSCYGRAVWLLYNGKVSADSALQTVESQCSEWCSCSLSEVQQIKTTMSTGTLAAPSTPQSCGGVCIFGKDTTPYACSDRLHFVYSTTSTPLEKGLSDVNNQCAKWCQCTLEDAQNIKARSTPTAPPTKEPTTAPTRFPTSSPTTLPTKLPTSSPTAPTSAPTPVNCNSKCVLGSSAAYSCKARLEYEFANTQMSAGDALALVNGQCVGQCACTADEATASKMAVDASKPAASPTALPTTSPIAPPTPWPTASPTRSPTMSPSVSPTAPPTWSPATSRSMVTCESDCVLGSSPAYSCKARLEYLFTTNPQMSAGDALALVNGQCTGQCDCTVDEATASKMAVDANRPTRNPTPMPTTSPTRSPTMSPIVPPTAPPTGSPTKSPTMVTCDSNCVLGSSPAYSCKARLAYEFTNTQKSAEDALSLVNGQCAGQCVCRSDEATALKIAVDANKPTPPPTGLPTESPTRSPTTWPTESPTASPTGSVGPIPPLVPGDCRASCVYGQDQTPHPCQDRIRWLLQTTTATAASALAEVNGQCSLWCQCTPADVLAIEAQFRTMAPTVMSVPAASATPTPVPTVQEMRDIITGTTLAPCDCTDPANTMGNWKEGHCYYNDATCEGNATHASGSSASSASSASFASSDSSGSLASSDSSGSGSSASSSALPWWAWLLIACAILLALALCLGLLYYLMKAPQKKRSAQKKERAKVEQEPLVGEGASEPSRATSMPTVTYLAPAPAPVVTYSSPVPMYTAAPSYIPPAAPSYVADPVYVTNSRAVAPPVIYAAPAPAVLMSNTASFMPSMVPCHNCGRELVSDANFCRFCGVHR